MTIDDLYITKAEHFYNEWCRAESLSFFAGKETYRHLGLLILSVVFHDRVPRVAVKLDHPHGDIKSLRVEYDQRGIDELTTGYHTRPFAFVYYPQLPGKHPFDRDIPPKHLPRFALAHTGNLNYTDEHWKQRDTVAVSGTGAGLVLCAELLLNLSLPDNEQDEIELEGESGFRGVGIGSAEVRLFLPGHLYWTEEHWHEAS